MGKEYKSVYITIRLSSETNKFLSESAERSRRRKLAEARLRLEDHLQKFRAISELNQSASVQSIIQDCIE